MKHWKKPLEESIKTMTKGCLCCGTTPVKLSMDFKIIQSFGGSHITKNGKIFYWPDECDLSESSYKKQKTLAWIEKQAKKQPKDDWRLINNMPMHDEEYQRQGENNWVMIKKGNGFA